MSRLPPSIVLRREIQVFRCAARQRVLKMNERTQGVMYIVKGS